MIYIINVQLTTETYKFENVGLAPFFDIFFDFFLTFSLNVKFAYDIFRLTSVSPEALRGLIDQVILCRNRICAGQLPFGQKICHNCNSEPLRGFSDQFFLTLPDTFPYLSTLSPFGAVLKYCHISPFGAYDTTFFVFYTMKMAFQTKVVIYFFVCIGSTVILSYYTTFYDEVCIFGLHCSPLMTSLPVPEIFFEKIV